MIMKELTEKTQNHDCLEKKKNCDTIKTVTIDALDGLHSLLHTTFDMDYAPKLNPYEMSQLGGAWIGHRLMWPDIKDSEVRLEIFYNTPRQLLEYFNHQFELTYPEQLGMSIHPTFSVIDDRLLLVIEHEVVAYVDKKLCHSNNVLVVEIACDPTKLSKDTLNYLLKEVQNVCRSKNLTHFEVYITFESNKLPTDNPGLTIKKYNLRYQEYIISGDLSTSLDGSPHGTEHYGLSIANEENTYFKQYIELKSKLARQRITFSLRDSDNAFLGFAVFEIPAHVLNLAHLGLLFLDPKIRRTGNGAKLLLTVESYLEKIKICNIRLTSPHYMAHTFYPTQGYAEIDRMPWPKDNLYLFFKPLPIKTDNKDITLCSPRVVEHAFLVP